MPSSPPAIIDNLPPWGDPWTYPAYYRGVTLRRVLAYAIDLLVIAALAVPLWLGLGLLGLMTLGLLLPLQALAIFLLPFAYHTLLIASPRAATVGMRTMGLRVMSVAQPLDAGPAHAGDGRPTLFQAMIQTVGFYASMALTGSLVLLVALFNPRRRTLHDWLAGTVVVSHV